MLLSFAYHSQLAALGHSTNANLRPGDRPGYHGAIATLLNILGHLVECSANDCVALSKVFRYLAESDTLVAMCIIRSYFKEHQYNTQYFSF